MKSKGAIAPPASINLDNVIYFDDLLSQSKLDLSYNFKTDKQNYSICIF